MGTGVNLATADDLALCRRAQEGDTAAFDELITRHREKIHMLTWQIVHNEEDALDLTQETFLRAWRSLPRLNLKNAASPLAWLRRIATNAAIDLFRKRRHRPQAELEDAALKIDAASRTTPSAGEVPGRGLDRELIRQRLSAALEKLSPEHRMVIVLKEMEDMSYEEIGRAAGCSTGTVMSRLFYARKNLQALLRDLHDEL